MFVRYLRFCIPEKYPRLIVGWHRVGLNEALIDSIKARSISTFKDADFLNYSKYGGNYVYSPAADPSIYSLLRHLISITSDVRCVDLSLAMASHLYATKHLISLLIDPFESSIGLSTPMKNQQYIYTKKLRINLLQHTFFTTSSSTVKHSQSYYVKCGRHLLTCSKPQDTPAERLIQVHWSLNC